MKRFFTNAVVLFALFGLILIIIGSGKYATFLFPKFITETSYIHTIIRTIGATLIGSGVFTAIIKSTEYSNIFSKVIGDVIWTEEYIKKHGNKLHIWSMVSKLLYEGKFPKISNEIEAIITDVYFPIAHNFYLEDYKFTLNLSNHNSNADYWIQSEVITFTIRPTSAKDYIEYKMGGIIDLPISLQPQTSTDLSSYQIQSISINDIQQTSQLDNPIKNGDKLTHNLTLTLQNCEEYKISIKRTKCVYKKTNPDKRLFVRYLVKGMTVTIICDATQNPDFHKMGTVHEFEKIDDQTNINSRFVTWHYAGLLLPNQGFIVIFK